MAIGLALPAFAAAEVVLQEKPQEQTLLDGRKVLITNSRMIVIDNSGKQIQAKDGTHILQDGTKLIVNGELVTVQDNKGLATPGVLKMKICPEGDPLCSDLRPGNQSVVNPTAGQKQIQQ